MYLVRNLNPLLTLSFFLLSSPVLAQSEGAEDEISDEDLIAEAEAEAGADDEVSDEDLIAEAEGEEISDEELMAQEEAAQSESAKEEAPSPEEESADTAVAEDAPAEAAPGGAGPEEQALFVPGEEPNRAPAAGKGVVWGRILDADSGDPVLEGSVKVQGRSVEAIIDFDGFFRLELPPGTYTLSLFVPLYEEELLSNVVVTRDHVGRVNASLQPQEGAVVVEVIQGKAETQTVEGLALARQQSAAQGDAVGREEISKTTDSNAAQAAKRVVGANIVGGRFIYVRGLGERYSNSLLGGYPLPSPEPDRAAVPLDVFPTAVIDSLTIVKTFTPDMPGDFAGGSVQIETRSVPKDPVFKIKVNGGFNTQSTFRERPDHGSSATDWLGFDSGMRSLPSSVPTDYAAKGGTTRPDGSQISDEELQQAGEDVNSPMHPKYSRSPFNHGASVVAGNTWDVGKTKLGVLAAANYSHKYQLVENATAINFDAAAFDPRGFAERNDFRKDEGLETVRWGAFGKVALVPDKNHEISITGLHSQLSDDRTALFYGYNRDVQADYYATQLDWVERGMTFGVLSGRHTFEKLKKAEFGWDVSIARAYRSQPDRRDTVYKATDRLPDPNDPRGRLDGWTYINKTESGRHFWAEQTEASNGGKLDWRQPILEGDTDLALKAGGLVNMKRRAFSARRFQMFPTGNTDSDPIYSCQGSEYSTDCPDQLFQNENIGDSLRLDEGSQAGDAYDAKLDVYAGYGLLDVDLSDRVRIVGGARYEFTHQEIEPLTPFGEEADIDGADLRSHDVLPAVSMVFNATKKFKTRLSYTHTLARPQVRELAPFSFANSIGGPVQTGNPDLELTKIKNVDMRIELWPSLTEVFAASVFYKDLKDPIEVVQLPSGGNPQLRYVNADRAQVIGTELEARKHVWGPLAVITNLTLTHSRTQVDEVEGNSILTSPSRPLINQAPWVFNFAVDYENESGTNSRLTYNVNSPTLVEVGAEGLPDGYRQSFHQLDFSISQKFWDHFNASGSVKNILNDEVVVSRGEDAEDGVNVYQKFKRGTVFGVALGYEM